MIRFLVSLNVLVGALSIIGSLTSFILGEPVWGGALLVGSPLFAGIAISLYRRNPFGFYGGRTFGFLGLTFGLLQLIFGGVVPGFLGLLYGFMMVGGLYLNNFSGYQSRSPFMTSSFKKRSKGILKYPPAVTGLVIILMMCCSALFADYLAPYSPHKEFSPPRQSPNAEHILGTNEIGQDLLSQTLYGGRLSIGLGLLSVGVALLIGVPLGLITGYFGGWIDYFVMRGIDFMMAFPGVLLAILLMSLFGQSREMLVLSVGLINVPTMVRQTRASVISVKQEEFVLASQALGSGTFRILFSRILPNVLGPIIVLATLGLGKAILETAGLGFLGLGLGTDAVEWGTMLQRSQEYLTEHPWIPIVPGIAVSLAVLGFNLLGDGLRDVLDPKQITS